MKNSEKRQLAAHNPSRAAPRGRQLQPLANRPNYPLNFRLMSTARVAIWRALS